MICQKDENGILEHTLNKLLPKTLRKQTITKRVRISNQNPKCFEEEKIYDATVKFHTTIDQMDKHIDHLSGNSSGLRSPNEKIGFHYDDW